MNGEKKQVGTHHFDDRENVLYDLMRNVTIRLELTQVVKEDPLEVRKYSIAELRAGVEKKLNDLHNSGPEDESDEAKQIRSEETPDLVLVSFYGFLAAPGLQAMVTGFHNSWLQGFYIAKLLKNRNIVVTAKRGTMTDEERQLAEEKIRDQGLDPYDPGRHGPAAGEDSAQPGS